MVSLSSFFFPASRIIIQVMNFSSSLVSLIILTSILDEKIRRERNLISFQYYEASLVHTPAAVGWLVLLICSGRNFVMRQLFS